jgi:DNA invertase Pin-like site-specific DNA recombinase
MSRRAAVYVRISRDREGAGLGIDRQEEDCRKLAADLGWDLGPVHADNDLSAYSGKPRPGYLALLDDLKAGRADAVICWHTDRLHRSPAELETYIAVCEPRGIPTMTVRAGPLDLTSPSGRMVARQLGAVARYEVEHMAERQQRARLQAVTDGRWSGGRRPYGYGPDGVTVVEVEAAIVREVAHQVLAGVSLRRLCADLNRRGVLTSTGKAWQQTSLRNVLLRARNAGLMEHRGQVVGPAGWPAILEEDTWRAVVGLLGDPGRRTQTTTARRWLLGNLASCGVCGDLVKSSSTSGRTIYKCRSGGHVVRDAAKTDAFVGDVIVERLRRPDARDLLTPDRRPDTAGLHAHDAALRERLDELGRLFADGAIDGRQLREGTERIRAQRDQLDRQLAAAAAGNVLAGVADHPDPAAAWERLDLDRQRAVVQVLCEVTILPARKDPAAGWRPVRGRFDPTTIRVTPKR